jgi:ABC-2 type transport system permease protein
LLFLDEPTTGFDPEARRAFWLLIKQLRDEGTTILLTTHYLDEAEELADRVAVMNHGQIIEISTPALLGGRAHAEAIVSWRENGALQQSSTATPTEFVAALARRLQGEIPELAIRRPSLEDIYLEMIKQFFRQRESVVFTLLFPLILLAIFGSVFNEKIAPGVTFSQYFVAGMIASALVNTGFQQIAIFIPIERDLGALKRLRGTPMPAVSYFIGKAILVTFSMLLQVLLLLAAGIAFFGVELPREASKWLLFFVLLTLGSVVSTILGVAFSSVPKSARGASAIVSPVVIVLQFFSGVFFIFTDLPQWMQQVAAIFPLKWLTQGMRSVFLPESFAAREVVGNWETGRTFAILGAWLIVGTILAIRTFRWDRD